MGEDREGVWVGRLMVEGVDSEPVEGWDGEGKAEGRAERSGDGQNRGDPETGLEEGFESMDLDW